MQKFNIGDLVAWNVWNARVHGEVLRVVEENGPLYRQGDVIVRPLGRFATVCCTPESLELLLSHQAS